MIHESKRRVLIVDDSALERHLLSVILSRHPMLEVAGVAGDPYEARERIKELDPDVLTLDVEMPRMDGLTFLEKLMKAHPMPVVMVSSLTARGTATAVEALNLGAVEVITKPGADSGSGLEAMGAEIAETVYAASLAQVQRRPAPSPAAHVPPLLARLKTGRYLIAIGSSTGGTEALRSIFEALPDNLPPIVAVQHMLPGFIPAFASRLDQACRVRVKVAEDGEPLSAGSVYLAPSETHLAVEYAGGRLYARLREGMRVSRHLPSIDVLFKSAAEACGARALGILLTGMGEDGADGLLQMRRKGARTIGQDEATCVVYGMPKAAWMRGAVAQQSALEAIPSRIAAWCNEGNEWSGAWEVYR